MRDAWNNFKIEKNLISMTGHFRIIIRITTSCIILTILGSKVSKDFNPSNENSDIKLTDDEMITRFCAKVSFELGHTNKRVVASSFSIDLILCF
jgi:hypothetical protein